MKLEVNLKLQIATDLKVSMRTTSSSGSSLEVMGRVDTINFEATQTRNYLKK